MLTHLLATLLLFALHALALKPSPASVRIFLAAHMTEMYPQMVTPEYAEQIADQIGEWTHGQWKCAARDRDTLDLAATRQMRSLDQVGKTMSVAYAAIGAHKPGKA